MRNASTADSTYRFILCMSVSVTVLLHAEKDYSYDANVHVISERRPRMRWILLDNKVKVRDVKNWRLIKR